MKLNGKEKSETSFDQCLIEENLSLSIEERLEKHQDAPELVEVLEQYKHTLSDESNLMRLLQVLSQSSLGFVLIGGFASMVHGSAVVTRDVGICMNLDQSSIDALRKTLSSYDPVDRMHPKKITFLKCPENRNAIQSLYINTTLGILDILNHVTGLGSFDEIKPASKLINISQDDRIRVLSKDQLIQSKKEMGRRKDLRVVQELENNCNDKVARDHSDA